MLEGVAQLEAQHAVLAEEAVVDLELCFCGEVAVPSPPSPSIALTQVYFSPVFWSTTLAWRWLKVPARRPGP